MYRKPPHRRLFIGASLAGLGALLAACSSPAPKAPVAIALPQTEHSPPETPPKPEKISVAGSPKDYRRDAASHLYGKNSERVFRGKLPPLLYAVGVLQVELDRQGHVTQISWMRAPRHAPEVMAEIERTVRQASPFPAPVNLGRVTYTDTWLWHKSGRFQLDTLTEGQA